MYGLFSVDKIADLTSGICCTEKILDLRWWSSITVVTNKREFLYRGITSTSEHVTAAIMNGDDLGNGGGLDSSSSVTASATSIENPFASPSAGIGDAAGASAFDSPMGGGMMFSGGGDDDDPFSGGGGDGGGGVNKDSMAEPASATDEFKRASPSMFQEMVEEDSMKQRDSDEVDFMANQVFLIF